MADSVDPCLARVGALLGSVPKSTFEIKVLAIVGLGSDLLTDCCGVFSKSNFLLS